MFRPPVFRLFMCSCSGRSVVLRLSFIFWNRRLPSHGRSLGRTHTHQRPSVLLFNAGCNNQVFPPKPWKKFRADPYSCLREKCKKPLHSDTLHSQKNDVTEPKAEPVSRLKVSVRLSETIGKFDDFSFW